MRYNGTDFNEDWVKTLTKKQFQERGRHGNNLTQQQLSECYDLITGNKKPNEDNIKSNKLSKKTGRSV